MADRTRFAAQGQDGGRPGALGELTADGAPLRPKTVSWLAPGARVRISLPGGGGYGDPRARPPEQVLADVAAGYVSVEVAEREYGVAVRYLGAADQIVRLPEHYAIDWETTARLRHPDHGAL